MNGKRDRIFAAAFVLMFFFCASDALAVGAEKQGKSDIELIIRADDIGFSHAANVGCIESYRRGVARTVEVMVPCPWFKEAVQMLRENPGLDVGVHLTLTSEWDGLKWGPLTRAPSLTDDWGYFQPMTRQRKDMPPGTGFLEGSPKLDEVEQELRAQIEMALEHIAQVSHLSCHMGTATATPELRALVDKLAKEYNLPVALPGVKRMAHYPSDASTEEKIDAMVEIIEGLGAGAWLFVEHPGQDVPEMRAAGRIGGRDEKIAKNREDVTRVFTSEKVKAAVKRKGARLISYADYLGRLNVTETDSIN